MQIVIEGETIELLKEKAIYWPAKKSLLLSDLHLGKVNHFRKAGMAVPARAGAQTLDTLASLLDSFQPEYVYFLGDLFHSVYNKDWERFILFREAYKPIAFHLIEGNHDILDKNAWDGANIIVHRNDLEVFPFRFVHDPSEASGELFSFAGHLHPCVSVVGAGKQNLRIPCFWRNKRQMVLPSFGSFTGMHPIKAKKGDEVFLVTEAGIFCKTPE